MGAVAHGRSNWLLNVRWSESVVISCESKAGQFGLISVIGQSDVMRDLTISDVAKRLGISRASAKTLVVSGRLIGYRIPVGKVGQLRVRECELDRFREANRVVVPTYSHRGKKSLKVVDLLDG